MVSINGVNCGYTANGNPYKKSSVGKNVGTVAGLASLAALETMPYSAYIKFYKKVGIPKELLKPMEKLVKDYKNPLSLAKAFIKGNFTKNIPTNSGIKFLDKVTSVLKNNKSARIAYVGSVLAIGALVYGGIGRLIGSVVDKCIDKGAKAEADRNAAIDKNA